MHLFHAMLFLHQCIYFYLGVGVCIKLILTITTLVIKVIQLFLREQGGLRNFVDASESGKLKSRTVKKYR